MQKHSRRNFLLQLPTGLAALTMALRAPQSIAQSATIIPHAALIEPADAAAMLDKPTNHRWKILQVGFHSMYDQKHIRGAVYAGPASRAEGLATLKQAVDSLPRTTPILLYCGCCPWTHCPNIAPAWGALQAMRFQAVRVIEITNNFGDDWVAKGYPVA